MTRLMTTLLALLLLLTGLSGCGQSDDPLAEGSSQADGKTIVIGSQQYYSNEIIAELYAQVLEANGYQVDRQYQIGQREVYLPEMEAGRINLLPEYNGNLLQYYDSESNAKTATEIDQALATALPEGIKTLTSASATDQDSYTVTRATAEEYGLETIGDLTKLPEPVKIGANSELETRPYGIPGLKDVYGVSAQLVPIEDSGSALTLKALLDGTVQVANIYSASPAIKENDLVTLQDPESMFLPQNIIPVVSTDLADEAIELIENVNAKLDTEALVALNDRSVREQLDSKTIAKDWLTEVGLLD